MYLVFDVETGGLDASRHSLLTAYFCIVDSELKKLDDLSLAIKSDTYSIDPKALAVNKIDLIAHHSAAIPADDAASKLLAFLSKHTSNGMRKLIPVGHNVKFDQDFIMQQLLGKSRMGSVAGSLWESYVSHRYLDTMAVVEMLRLKGCIPPEWTNSLSAIANLFAIPQKEAHTAMDDVVTTIAVLKMMSTYVVGPKNL